MDRFGLESGTIRLRHTVWAILLAHVFFNVAVVVRSVGGFWGQLDRRPEEAARTLGASPAQAFVLVTLPRLRASLLAALSIVFLFSFTSFAVILLLGGPRRSTIETEIFRWAVTRGDISTAAALSVVQIQMVAVAALVLLNLRLQRRSAGHQGLINDRAIPIRAGRDRGVVAASLIGPRSVSWNPTCGAGRAFVFDGLRLVVQQLSGPCRSGTDQLTVVCPRRRRSGLDHRGTGIAGDRARRPIHESLAGPGHVAAARYLGSHAWLSACSSRSTAVGVGSTCGAHGGLCRSPSR
ncbi:Thiamine transport system permease protein ThiP [Nymphon striatum]|nr:Thiamine transport system permease protein ThiP [Nymphon striatum]